MKKQIIAFAAGAAMLLAVCGPITAGAAGQPPSPIGTVDAAASNGKGGIHVAGWAFDPNTTGPIQVRVYINGVYAGSGTANTSRPDVGAAYPGYGNNHGYSFIVPGGLGNVCTYGINFGPGGNSTLGCVNLTPPPRNPIGTLEAAATNNHGGVQVAGWTFDPNTTAPIAVHVYINGAYAGSGTANGSRPDVGAAYPGYGNNHGYAFIVPSGAQPGAQVCTYGINFGPGGNATLGCFNLAGATPPPAGGLTPGQRNAQAKAYEYLVYLGGFSHQGLIDQVVFEGYSVGDATVGVDSLNVDWYDQAVKSALDYLACCSPWSHQGLIDQLLYEKFTLAQATWGVTRVGL
jgi:hypothetical protein